MTKFLPAIGSLLFLLGACSTGSAATAESTSETSSSTTQAVAEVASDNFLGSYELNDIEFGTSVTVTVNDTTRQIVANALPNHDTGEFPNSGNPNTITEQDKSFTYPATGTYVGVPTIAQVPGVAVNGVKFEPGTAETALCDSGETYRIEALQDVYNLGLDFNNAHVQPNGEYHYHGISELLVDAYLNDGDLVHVGFAADGHLIYYSKSQAFTSSYVLRTEARSGTDCVATGPSGSSFDLEGTTPDGTYSEDWVVDSSIGDLDECNGAIIDGTYAYVITDTYPFIGRCLMGEVSASATSNGPDGAVPQQQPGSPPDLSEAADALGVSEQELIDALGFPPDPTAAAEKLGVSVDELTALLPPPPGG